MADLHTVADRDALDVSEASTDIAPAAPDAATLSPNGSDTIEAAMTRLREGLSSLSLTSRFSREELDTIYSLAWSHLHRDQNDTALRLFLFLTDHASTDALYLMGLGVCLQRLERHAQALQVFSWIGMLHSENIEASLRSAECLLSLRQREQAEALLDFIVSHAIASPGVATPVAFRAQALLDVLRRGSASTLAPAEAR
jgi:tetratricopeptide (TPR) repeat protein